MTPKSKGLYKTRCGAVVQFGDFSDNDYATAYGHYYATVLNVGDIDERRSWIRANHRYYWEYDGKFGGAQISNHPMHLVKEIRP